MISEQLMQLRISLDDLNTNGQLTDKSIIVFGSNEPAERMIDYLEEKGIPVYTMIDNNDKKYTFSYHGVPVCRPEEVLSPYNEKIVILIASRYYYEMLRQVQKYGYSENIQVFSIVNMQAGSRFSLDQQTFDKELEQVKRGKSILENIKEQYGSDTMIFIFPWQAIGDIYMAARYLNSYVQKHDIKKYVITVMGNLRKKIAELCGYNSIIVLTGQESAELARASLFLGFKSTNTMIIHHKYLFVNQAWKLGNYKGITFADNFHYTIYGLDESAEVTEPPKHGNKETLSSLFKDNDLIKGKTVILSPYANTVTNPPDEFWNKLAEKLMQLGYCVCTNSSGSSEPAISGTKPVLFGFDIMLEAIEYAGYFIGLRSGLCDYIATANGKKIIIFPDRIYNYGPVIDFYSLKRMGLTENSDEVIYKDDNMNVTLDEILKIIEE